MRRMRWERFACQQAILTRSQRGASVPGVRRPSIHNRFNLSLRTFQSHLTRVETVDLRIAKDSCAPKNAIDLI
jgi:hypothetical protein